MMKAYKGFNIDMTCRGFQYEEGKEYEAEGDVKLCYNGFHACEDPLDCLFYYGPRESVYHEVELDGVSDERGSDDTKVVAKRIRVGARVSIAGLVEACIKFRFSKTTSVKKNRSWINYGVASPPQVTMVSLPPQVTGVPLPLKVLTLSPVHLDIVVERKVLSVTGLSLPKGENLYGAKKIADTKVRLKLSRHSRLTGRPSSQIHGMS